jgi:L-amino acid N-acyltransferase YncA
VRIVRVVSVSPSQRHVRPATVDDARACAAIYAPYVETTAISFELVPPSVEQMAARIESSLDTHAWFVMEEGHGQVLGYAYAAQLNRREAYRWSCEVSVYVDHDSRRTGAGRALYEALFARLVERGYLQAIAGMTLPNEASAGLHRAMGFESMGVYRRIGYKLGAWHDVAWMQRPLGRGEEEPPADLR